MRPVALTFGFALALAFAPYASAQPRGHSLSSKEDTNEDVSTAKIPAADRACYARLKKELAKRIVRLKQDAFAYHWMPNKGTQGYPKLDPARPDFADAARKILDQKAARFWDKNFEDGGFAGEGLYAATDPIYSRDYCQSPDSGIMAKIHVKKGQKFLAYKILGDPKVSAEMFNLEPECPKRGNFSAEYPGEFYSLYQTAARELSISGVIYSYHSEPFDQTGACPATTPAKQSPKTPRKPDPKHPPKFSVKHVAFVLFDRGQINSSQTQIFSREQIIQDSPIKESDIPEALYYKYSLFHERDWQDPKNTNTETFRKFREWADKNIMSLHKLDEFLESGK